MASRRLHESFTNECFLPTAPNGKLSEDGFLISLDYNEFPLDFLWISLDLLWIPCDSPDFALENTMI